MNFYLLLKYLRVPEQETQVTQPCSDLRTALNSKAVSAGLACCETQPIVAYKFMIYGLEECFPAWVHTLDMWTNSPNSNSFSCEM